MWISDLIMMKVVSCRVQTGALYEILSGKKEQL